VLQVGAARAASGGTPPCRMTGVTLHTGHPTRGCIPRERGGHGWLCDRGKLGGRAWRDVGTAARVDGYLGSYVGI